MWENKMVLKGNFYNTNSVESLGNGEYSVMVTICNEHPIYAGHFPQQAVVPGVCTLTIVKECIGEILGRMVVFDTIKDCKYVSALLPQEELSITLNISLGEENKVKVAISRNDNGQAVLKLRATIR